MAAEETPPRRVVARAGHNWSTWPNLKWERARRHLRTLQAQFTEWVATVPVASEGVLHADGRTVEAIVHVRSAPPVYEFALTLGDFFHNLRSSLDATAWEIAHFDGRSPAKPKLVQFPVCSTEEQWDDAVRRWIGDVDDQFAERMRSIQPFAHHVPSGSRSPLQVLHDFDIQDKHKTAIEVRVACDAALLDNCWFQLADPSTQAEPRILATPTGALVDGASLVTIDAGGAVADFDFTPVPVLTPVATLDAAEFPLDPFGEQLLFEVGRYVRFLTSVEDPALQGSPAHAPAPAPRG